jgi:hypothetical protein
VQTFLQIWISSESVHYQRLASGHERSPLELCQTSPILIDHLCALSLQDTFFRVTAVRRHAESA